MRGHLEAGDFGHLQFDEAVDEVVVEPAASLAIIASYRKYTLFVNST
jgi:hypothetical protein